MSEHDHNHGAHEHGHGDGHGHGHGHDHDHDHGLFHHHHDHSSAPERALWMAILLNGAFLIVEIVVGILTNSLALLADAGHMASDVGALVIALIAQRLAARPVKGAFTFGLKRMPVLAGLVNALALLVIVALIVRESIERFANPPHLEGEWILITGIVGLLINVASAVYLARVGDHSVNIRGAMLHMIADALGSIAVIVGAVVIMTTDWWLIDPLLGMIVALLILVVTWPLLRDTFNILMQKAPAHVDVEHLRETVLATDTVERILDLHLWELNSGQFVLSAALESTGNLTLEQSSTHADTLREQLRERFGIVHCTLEWRAPDCPTPDCHFHEHDHDHAPAANHNHAHQDREPAG